MLDENYNTADEQNIKSLLCNELPYITSKLSMI
jgi:hypothetical protein